MKMILQNLNNKKKNWLLIMNFWEEQSQSYKFRLMNKESRLKN
jgi:hypothetical protein